MTGSINIEEHGLVGDGVADDSGAFSAAFDAMIVSGAHILRLPANRRIRIAARVAKQFAGRVEIVSQGGTELLIDADQRGLAFSGMPGVSGRTLSADVPFQSWTVLLSDTAGVEPGQLLCLLTETLVLTKANWPYRKQAHILIADVDHAGGIVHLMEPANFHFTADETSVDTLVPSELGFSGIDFTVAGHRGLRLTGLDWLIDRSTMRGPEVRALTEVLRLSRCVKGRGNNLKLLDSGYTINISSGSRHQHFSQIEARGVRHPIDPNTFAFDTLVEDMEATTPAAPFNATPRSSHGSCAAAISTPRAALACADLDAAPRTARSRTAPTNRARRCSIHRSRRNIPILATSTMPGMCG